jgi:hypothetical protein
MNTSKITANILLISSMVFSTNVAAQAKQRHQIGFIKGVVPGGEAGGCDYSIAGSNERKVILSENYLKKSVTINIDGQNIMLKQIQRKSIITNKNKFVVDFKYKSQDFQIQGHLKDATK